MVFKDLCRKSLHQVSFSNFSFPRSWKTHCFQKVAKGNVFWSISPAETFPLMTHMRSLKKGFFHHFTCGYLAGESQTQSGNLGLASSKAQALPTRQHCFVARWMLFPGSASHQVWLPVWLLEFKLLLRPLSSAVLSIKLAWIPWVSVRPLHHHLPSVRTSHCCYPFLYISCPPASSSGCRSLPHQLPNTKCWVCSHLSWPLGQCHPHLVKPRVPPESVLKGC